MLNQCRLVSVWFVGTQTIAVRQAACLTQHSYLLSKRHWNHFGIICQLL